MKFHLRPDARAANHFFVGVFDDEAGTIEAVKTARKEGWVIDDVYTPYPVHGLDKAMGLPPTRLPIACLVYGMIGLTIALSFQYWSTAVDWPINIGGKPWNSLPAFVPVTFEMMVLFAGLGTVASLLVRTGLLPGKSYRHLIEGMTECARVTDDRFLVVLLQGDAKHDFTSARRLLRSLGAVATQHGLTEGSRAEAVEEEE